MTDSSPNGRMDPEPRVYPLPRPAADDRFCFGLLVDVKRAIEAHGYPEISAGRDLIELQQAIFRFLYETQPNRHRVAHNARGHHA